MCIFITLIKEIVLLSRYFVGLDFAETFLLCSFVDLWVSCTQKTVDFS